MPRNAFKPDGSANATLARDKAASRTKQNTVVSRATTVTEPAHTTSADRAGRGIAQNARTANRRRVLRSILACALGAPALTAAAVRAPAGHRFNLPIAQDLAQDGARSAAEHIPVLLFFDRSDCPYCERALREFLVPMAKSPEWGGRAVYRQVEIDRGDALIDFSGQRTTHRDLANRHRIRLTPTIFVVDGQGNPLGRPLVGLMTVDFYGAYLERAIEDATGRLRGAGTGTGKA